MIKDVGQFTIRSVQVLDEHGNADDSLMPELSQDEIRTMYWYMVLGRVLDQRMLTLQRQGRMGTFASTEGQEACQAGSAIQLRKDDWMAVAFRENVAALIRGITPLQLLQYWGGDERGCYTPDNRTLPVSIPVGSQTLHAVGTGFASMFHKTDEVSLVYFGDGATSEGEFHEALNLAGVYNTPTIFFCQNNQYAISTPVKKQTKSGTIAQKAVAYGIAGVQVDGNDVFAVYQVMKDAIDRARKGEGPTLIEAVTYRLNNHTTSDDWRYYRTEEEVEEARKKDPLPRLKNYMQQHGFWSEEDEKAAWDHAKEIVEAAVKEFESLAPQKPEELFDSLYEALPPLIKEQRELFLKEQGGSQ